MPTEVGDEIVNLDRAVYFVYCILDRMAGLLQNCSIACEGEEKKEVLHVADVLRELQDHARTQSMRNQIRLALDESRYYEDGYPDENEEDCHPLYHELYGNPFDKTRERFPMTSFILTICEPRGE